MNKIIKPQTPKGFRDLLPEDARIKQKVIDVFRKTFEKYGYEPLEPPTVEYAETILGKYGEEGDKLVYTFKDRGGRNLALKYDMTVSACRIVAQYQHQLTFPFKRYQIQPAFRAEKPQKGRFREFTQCDADVFGTKSALADAEFIQMGIEAVSNLGFRKYRARINNRKIINALVKYAGASENQFYDISVSIDKLEKIGVTGVKEELEKRKVGKEIVEKLLPLVSQKETSEKMLKRIEEKVKRNKEGMEGIDEVKIILEYLANVGLPSSTYEFDPSIVRGLAYYTGPVWEFEILEGQVGSIAGCGRYDKLVGMFTGHDIPATGGSFGIERIIEVIKDRNIFEEKFALAKILVTIFDKKLQAESVKLANKLRKQSITVELYLDPNVKLDKQLKYADRKGIPFVAIMGPDEVKNKTITIKNLKTKKQQTLKEEEVVDMLTKK